MDKAKIIQKLWKYLKKSLKMMNISKNIMLKLFFRVIDTSMIKDNIY